VADGFEHPRDAEETAADADGDQPVVVGGGDGGGRGQRGGEGVRQGLRVGFRAFVGRRLSLARGICDGEGHRGDGGLGWCVGIAILGQDADVRERDAEEKEEEESEELWLHFFSFF